MQLKLANNLFLKVLSVVLAILIWLVVVNISDAEGIATFSKEVVLLNTDVVTENGKVFRVEEGTNYAKITVRARESIRRELKADDFILTADLEKDLKFNDLVEIRVECKNKSVMVDQDVELSRNNVKLSIEDAATEQFPIQVEYTGTENEGLVVGSLVPEQTIIKITGPVSIVERIKTVKAVVDVTGLPATTVKTCNLKLYDGDNDVIDTTYLNYVGKSDGLDVTVNMLHSKMVPLMFGYTGEPDEDVKITDVYWEPELVEVAGTADVLSNLTSLRIPSEVVDVSGIKEELQMVVDITPYLPSGIVLKDESGKSVLVVVEVENVVPEEEQKDQNNQKTENGKDDKTKSNR